MGSSVPAVIGALIGAFLGLINSGVAMRYMLAAFERNAAALPPAERAKADRKILLLRRLVMVGMVLGFAILGASFGVSVAGKGL